MDFFSILLAWPPCFAHAAIRQIIESPKEDLRLERKRRHTRGREGKSVPRLAKALILGGLTALAGVVLSATPWGLDLEENLGLDGLFMLRGERAPPPEVIVVSLDKVSADRLGLPNEPEKWPRTLHARLVDELARQGAAVIVFDIIFNEPRVPAHDAQFARAVRRAGNVVLFEYVKKETLPVTDGMDLTLERLVPPFPPLTEAAAATAPFPLPKVPVKVSQFWLFKTGAGDRATLPVAAFQIYALSAYDELRQRLHTASPEQAAVLPPSREEVLRTHGVQELIHKLKVLLHQQPEIGAHLLQDASGKDGDRERLLRSLVSLYRDGDSRYLNYYGPPRRLATVPYYTVLEDGAREAPPDLRGKAVFVGFAEQLQPEQKDGFYTVFSQASGLDISGVEIAATAFANLLEDLPVRPLNLGAQLGLVAAWGMLIGLVCMGWRALPGIAALGGLCALYLALAYSRFESGAHWYPLVVPLLGQAPAALLAALLWHYLDTNRERRFIRKAFGYYLPDRVVDELARNLTDVRASNRTVYGACLATDAEKYTALAETMKPEQLGALMNRYYEAVFRPVRDRHGYVSDVIGDSMLAIWAEARSAGEPRAQACRAALDIVRAVDRFNRTSGAPALPTRIGLHAGEMLLGNIGAMDHYEYRAVGDIVNTAARLQALNKVLRTRILASHESVAGLKEFVTRDLGVFLLPGKSKPVAVCELRGVIEEVDAPTRQFCSRYADALNHYRQRRWEDARAEFARVLEQNPSDGPSLFYLERCRHLLAEPPGRDWTDAVAVDVK
jgi:adenylate cyclase